LSGGTRDLGYSNWMATSTGGSWPASVRSPAMMPSHLGLLRHFEGIVDLDAEVSHRALDLRVPEE
jgi:hypothetical protein